MRKYAIIMMMAAAMCGCLRAGDKGPQEVPTTGNLKTGLVIVPPAGDTGRFTPEWIIHSGEQDTQSVYYVSGSVTNLMLVYTNTAALKVKSLGTLFPPLFGTDRILITRPTSYSLTNETVKILGTLYD